MWLVKHKCPTLTGGVFLTFLTQYLSKFKTNLNLNGGYPKKCKEKNEIDLEALYIPGQAKKTKNLSYTDVFLFWPLFYYFLVLGSKFCNLLALYGSRSCQKLFCTHLGIPEMILGQNIQMSYTDVFILLPFYLYQWDLSSKFCLFHTHLDSG